MAPRREHGGGVARAVVLLLLLAGAEGGLRRGAAQTLEDQLRTPVVSSDSSRRIMDAWFRSQVPPFPGDLSLPGWDSLGAAWKQALQRVLERIAVPRHPAPRLEPRGEVRVDSLVIRRFVAEIYQGFPVPVNLYLPESCGVALPLVLLPNGFFLNGKAEPEIQALGRTLVRAGYAAASWDFVHTGERGGWNGVGSRGNHSYHALWWRLFGTGTPGLAVGELSGLLDLLGALPEVDTSRVAAAGSSQGAMTALLASVVDGRIDAVVGAVPPPPLKQVTRTEDLFTEERYLVWDGSFPRDLMKEIPDLGGLAALNAPRPTLLLSGTGDVSPPAWLGEERDRAGTVFSLLGAGDRLRHDSLSMGHEFSREARMRACTWINRWIRGDAAASDTTERDFTPLPPESLSCGITHSSTVLSVAAALVSARPSDPDDPLSREEAARFQDSMAASVTRVVGAEPDSVVSWREVDSALLPEGISRRFLLEFRRTPPAPSVVVSVPGQAGCIGVLVVTDSGMAGADCSFVRELLARGYAVMALDRAGTGPMRLPGLSERAAGFCLEATGTTLTGAGLGQIHGAAAFFRREWDLSRVILAAEGPGSHHTAMLAAAGSWIDGFICLGGVDGYGDLSPGGIPCDLPPRAQYAGSFLHPDIASLAGLVSPRPLFLAGLRGSDGSSRDSASSRTPRIAERFHRAFDRSHLLAAGGDGSGGTEAAGWLARTVPAGGGIVLLGAPASVAREGESFLTRVLTNVPGPTLFRGDTLPPWLSLDPARGILQGVPGPHDVGRSRVCLTVRTEDGDSAALGFPLEVRHVNHPPFFAGRPDTTVLPGSEYAYAPEVADPDSLFDESLRLRLLEAPSWIRLDGAHRILKGTPGREHVGRHAILLEAADRSGLTCRQSFDLAVTYPQHPPRILSKPLESAQEDSLYRCVVAAVDPDTGYGDSLRYALTEGPAWLRLDPPGGILTGRPRGRDVGLHRVTVGVSDRGGNSVRQTFVLRVLHTDHPPLFLSRPVCSAVEGRLYVYRAHAADPDSFLYGDRVIYRLVTGPSWLSMERESGVLSGVPPLPCTRDTIVEIAAHSTGAGMEAGEWGAGPGDSGTATPIREARQRYVLTVEGWNDPPVFVSVPVLHASPGVPYVYAVQAVDPDSLRGDVVCVTLEESPPWLKLHPESLELGGIPPRGGSPLERVRLKATDERGGKTSQEFQITMRSGRVAAREVRISAGGGDRLYLNLDSMAGVNPRSVRWLARLSSCPDWVMLDTASGLLHVTVPPRPMAAERFCALAGLTDSGDTLRQTLLLEPSEEGEAPGGGYVLEPNYPNPFNPRTVIAFHIPVASTVRLSVCDILGREVALVADGVRMAGRYEVSWSPGAENGRSVSSGVYFCRLAAAPLEGGPGYRAQRRMVLTR
ncbi:MAG: putative Ig domain-containing protein [Bacteroidota bacterium]